MRRTLLGPHERDVRRRRDRRAGLALADADVVLHRTFRTSGRALSSIERELSSGFCGLSKPDAAGMVARHGRAAAIAQLRAASVDGDLAPFIRGRASLALDQLAGKP